jgi:hypothetical protein
MMHYVLVMIRTNASVARFLKNKIPGNAKLIVTLLNVLDKLTL